MILSNVDIIFSTVDAMVAGAMLATTIILTFSRDTRARR
jgi:hypothetical protein